MAEEARRSLAESQTLRELQREQLRRELETLRSELGARQRAEGSAPPAPEPR